MAQFLAGLSLILLSVAGWLIYQAYVYERTRAKHVRPRPSRSRTRWLERARDEVTVAWMGRLGRRSAPVPPVAQMRMSAEVLEWITRQILWAQNDPWKHLRPGVWPAWTEWTL